MNAPSSGDQFVDVTNPRIQQNNRQVIIEMPGPSDHSTDTMADEVQADQRGNETNSELSRNDNHRWQLNIEINRDVLNANLNQEDVNAIAAAIRHLFRHIDLLYFVPEAHVLNLFMLFLTVVVVLSGRVLLNIFGLILLGVIRLSYYFDGYRFDLKNETQLLTILIRTGIRNLAVYLAFDQKDYINVLTFNAVETESFIYVLFVICMANMMAFDVMLTTKIFVGYLPFIQIRHKKEFIKVFEHFVVLYVSLLPVIQWYTYIGSAWLSIPYFILKFIIYTHLIVRSFMVLCQFFKNTKVGVVPSKTELYGQICAICHSEPEDKPIKTPCGHIFDEQCLKEWLEVKNECPMCRRTVVEKHVHYEKAPLFPPYFI